MFQNIQEIIILGGKVQVKFSLIEIILYLSGCVKWDFLIVYFGHIYVVQLPNKMFNTRF